MTEKLTAQSWLQSFRTHFKPADLEGGAWSPHMFDVLHAVRSDFGLWCQCEFGTQGQNHGRKGEFLEIDMMWFLPGDPSHDYDAPLFALEHENMHTEFHAKQDFWRVFQVAAPLRVFIGYAKAKKVAGLVESLVKMRWEDGTDRFHSLPGGQDVALIGGYPMTGWESWSGRVWSGGRMLTLDDFMRSGK